MLITGGNGGIGLGVGRACARAGADIVVWGRNGDKNATARAELRSLGVRAHALVVDASAAADDPVAALDHQFQPDLVRVGRALREVVPQP